MSLPTGDRVSPKNGYVEQHGAIQAALLRFELRRLVKIATGPYDPRKQPMLAHYRAAIRQMAGEHNYNTLDDEVSPPDFLKRVYNSMLNGEIFQCHMSFFRDLVYPQNSNKIEKRMKKQLDRLEEIYYAMEALHGENENAKSCRCRKKEITAKYLPFFVVLADALGKEEEIAPFLF